jgi:hypothetical protein
MHAVNPHAHFTRLNPHATVSRHRHSLSVCRAGSEPAATLIFALTAQSSSPSAFSFEGIQMDAGPAKAGKCRGLDCTSPDLIRAHIMPKGFARLIRDDAQNMTVSLESAAYANPQLGEYDTGILCATCDNKLGLFDNYGHDVCATFDARHRKLPNDLFEVSGFDGDKFAKFILAVLWRGSISSRLNYADVALGRYEEAAREVLFAARPLAEFPELQVLVHRYKSEYFDTTGFYSIPVVAPSFGLHAFGFALAGFKVMAKLDQQPLPPEWASFIVNGSDVLRGFFVTIEDTPEFQRVASMVVAELSRGSMYRPPG